METQRKPRIGLALGSGGARGWAHIGVLEVLEEAGVPIDMVAGTSIGSYVGAIYVAGDLAALRSFAMEMDWRKILMHLDIVVPRSGFIDGRRVLEVFSELTTAKNFAELDRPFQAVAADLHSGQEHVMSTGPLESAIRASISVPGILKPVKRDGLWLVDGGVVNPLPVSVLRAMGADLIIAVDLNAHLLRHAKRRRRGLGRGSQLDESRQATLQRWIERTGLRQSSLTERINRWFTRDESSPQILDVLAASVNIMQYRITLANLALVKPDFLIQPEVGHLGLFDFDEAEYSIAAGRRSIQDILPDILKRIDGEL